MKKIISLILVAMLCMGLVACGTAKTNAPAESQNASDMSYIKDKNEMVIGITYFEPMNYQDDKGELTGFETEFAKAVCEKIGVTPKFQEINWDSKEVELNSKNIDCIWNGMTITDDRKANMSISTPYMENKQVMVVKAENKDKFSQSVEGVNVVAEQGSAGEELAQGDEFFGKANYTPVDSQAKALMDVASGTSDVAIVDYVTSIGSIGDDTDFSGLVVVDAKSFGAEQYGVAFRKGSDVTEKVNAAMQELAKDGTLKAIAEKYKLQDLIIVK